MKRILFVAALLVPAIAAAQTTVTLLQFSDYHSHALPFYSESRAHQGGIARAIGYLKREKSQGAFVFSGGDMINKGSPAWSDKYQCREWPWFNGVVDAMAFGNHDADYGRATFDRCRAAVKYPILSANTTLDGGPPFLPYTIVKKGNLRIGIFALAGSDFPSLVKAEGVHFSDAVTAARDVVRTLRDKEHVDAVVSIGHQSIDDDFALARAVPGIDLIFGSHSHLKRDLQTIDGTNTWYVSPFQYLTYISRVQLVFRGHRLSAVRGGVVHVDESLPIDSAIAKRVAAMEAELEHDPAYAALFEKIGVAATPIEVGGLLTRDCALGDLVMDVTRTAANADVALSTSSSFRQAIDAGPIAMEGLRAALPYDNEIVVYEMTGAKVKELLAFMLTRRDTDFFSQVSGVRIPDTQLEDAKTYRVATNEYLAKVAPGYRDFFAELTAHPTGLRIRDEVRKYIGAHSPVTATRDGRIKP
ncbi:MAG: 5-nucleotidase / UDP-sugar diphosphatase [Acidobacteriota bacterium]|jgi:5'-nucleotidase|nr:5-nucleotidase / UDP-sugar diphosphatase [Acidobacteriota bacterium]